jgi:Flp pilus assembly protein TadD
MLRPDDRDDRLALAETLFQNVIASEPNDPGALNGLGSVAMLRGRLAEAKTMIRKALDIEPGYAAALHDLQQIEDYEHRIGTD